ASSTRRRTPSRRPRSERPTSCACSGGSTRSKSGSRRSSCACRIASIERWRGRSSARSAADGSALDRPEADDDLEERVVRVELLGLEVGGGEAVEEAGGGEDVAEGHHL